ncbi:hypothetical protein MKX01_011333, partial [Papaver californicum]
VVCILADKPKEDPDVDIDGDADNQLAAVEYIEELYTCYKLKEFMLSTWGDTHLAQKLQ